MSNEGSSYERIDEKGRAGRRDAAGRYEVAYHQSPVAYYAEESHDSIQICVPLDRARYRVERQSSTGYRLTHDLGCRDILMIPESQAHAIDWRRPAGVVTLYLSQTYLNETIDRPMTEPMDAITLRDPFVSSAAVELAASLANPSEATKCFTEAMVTVITYRVGMGADCRSGVRTSVPVAPLLNWQTVRIDAFIDANLDEDISLSQLSSLVNLTPWHFTRRFTASQGVTPHDYITRRRFERAMSLLKDTQLSITEVALDVGLSHSHFSRTFLSRYGLSPREYRAQCGSAPIISVPPFSHKSPD